MEVHNIVQEAVTKSISKKKKCKKTKWLSKEALQIAKERREAKSKGERERYTRLKCRVPENNKRDKKIFLSEQCKQIEENNRMGKTRDVFKKIGDIKKTFHARMGMIKDRNSKDLTEAEEIKKRWQEYTEELYKKDLNDADNLDGVITHLEPDILECEVKGALGSTTLNKASGSDAIPAELFQVLKDDAIQILKCWTQYARKFGKLRMATGLENVSFHSNLKEDDTKECSNYHTIVLISHASKFMLKILQARLHQYMSWELADLQVGLKKAEESDQTANIYWIMEKARKFQENIYFCFIDYAKAIDCVDHNKLWKILKEMRVPRPPYLSPEKSVCSSKSNS